MFVFYLFTNNYPGKPFQFFFLEGAEFHGHFCHFLEEALKVMLHGIISLKWFTYSNSLGCARFVSHGSSVRSAEALFACDLVAGTSPEPELVADGMDSSTSMGLSLSFSSLEDGEAFGSYNQTH